MANVRLTERQLEVLRLGCFTSVQIGMILGMARSTVKNHFTGVYRTLCPEARLEDRKRCLAMMRALELGLLQADDVPAGDWETFERLRRESGQEV